MRYIYYSNSLYIFYSLFASKDHLIFNTKNNFFNTDSNGKLIWIEIQWKHKPGYLWKFGTNLRQLLFYDSFCATCLKASCMQNLEYCFWSLRQISGPKQRAPSWNTEKNSLFITAIGTDKSEKQGPKNVWGYWGYFDEWSLRHALLFCFFIEGSWPGCPDSMKSAAKLNWAYSHDTV